MTFNELTDLLKATVLNGPGDHAPEITGGYACDMISRAVSSIQDGQVWITILNSRNVVAAAMLSDCCCVVLAESVTMEDDTVRVARDNNVPVIRTELSAYETCAAIHRRLEG